MTIGILPLIKKVFNSEEMDKRDEKFLNYLSEHLQKPFKKIDKNSITSVELPIIFIRSGGVEGDFKELFSKLKPPYILLTPDRRSALAAALEISYYIRKKGFDAEIIHGEEIYMVNRIKALDKIFSAKKQIKNSNIGIVGNSANWLIASDVDKNKIRHNHHKRWRCIKQNSR
jgi:L-fucose isomerase-like protein